MGRGEAGGLYGTGPRIVCTLGILVCIGAFTTAIVALAMIVSQTKQLPNHATDCLSVGYQFTQGTGQSTTCQCHRRTRSGKCTKQECKAHEVPYVYGSVIFNYWVSESNTTQTVIQLLAGGRYATYESVRSKMEREYPINSTFPCWYAVRDTSSVTLINYN